MMPDTIDRGSDRKYRLRWKLLDASTDAACGHERIHALGGTDHMT
jgi:hypothetical protein